MSRDLRPFAQWPKAQTRIPAPAANLGVLVQSASGGWAVSTEPDTVAEASLVASASGGLAADDAMPAGGRVRRVASRTIGMI